MKEILENFFPNIDNQDLINSHNKLKSTTVKSKKCKIETCASVYL